MGRMLWGLRLVVRSRLEILGSMYGDGILTFCVSNVFSPHFVLLFFSYDFYPILLSSQS